MSCIRACIRRSRGQLTHATLAKYSGLACDAVTYIVKQCPKLQYLELRDSPESQTWRDTLGLATNLTTLICSDQLVMDVLYLPQLLISCKALARAEFHQVSSFRYGYADWHSNLPQLRELTMRASGQGIVERLVLVCHPLVPYFKHTLTLCRTFSCKEPLNFESSTSEATAVIWVDWAAWKTPGPTFRFSPTSNA